MDINFNKKYNNFKKMVKMRKKILKKIKK